MQISWTPKVTSSVSDGRNQTPDCMVTPMINNSLSISERRVTIPALTGLAISAFPLKRKNEAIRDNKSIKRSAAGMRTMKNEANIGTDLSGINALILGKATSSVEYDFPTSRKKRGERQKIAPTIVKPKFNLTENLKVIGKTRRVDNLGTEEAPKNSPSYAGSSGNFLT